MNLRRLFMLAVPAAAMAASVGHAAPQAGPKAATWQFDVRFHDPQRLDVQLPGDASTTTFWYLLYEVTNRTGQDRSFYPSIRLVTDTLQVVQAGENVHPMVYDVIAARHKRAFPFLAPPAKVTGPALQGEENARASVAVFRDFDPSANRFTIYAAGFSGDVRQVVNPTFDPYRPESVNNRRFFTLRRTLAIVYDLPGDPGTRDQARPIRRTRAWVMR